MKYVLFLYILLSPFLCISEEVVCLRIISRNRVELLPLKSVNAMTINILDTLNFDYEVKVEGLKLLDSRIFVNIPIYDRINGNIQVVSQGINVKFIHSEWMLQFLKSHGLEFVELNKLMCKVSRKKN